MLVAQFLLSLLLGLQSPHVHLLVRLGGPGLRELEGGEEGGREGGKEREEARGG
jgi:hypothetical protein